MGANLQRQLAGTTGPDARCDGEDSTARHLTATRGQQGKETPHTIRPYGRTRSGNSRDGMWC